MSIAGKPTDGVSLTVLADALAPYATISSVNSALNTKLNTTGGAVSGLLSFSGLDSVGVRLKSLTSAQYGNLTPADGDIYIDTTTNRIDARVGGTTREVIDNFGGQQIGGTLGVTGLVTLGGNIGWNATQFFRAFPTHVAMFTYGGFGFVAPRLMIGNMASTGVSPTIGMVQVGEAIQIDNGTTGTLRDLGLRSLTASGTVTASRLALPFDVWSVASDGSDRFYFGGGANPTNFYKAHSHNFRNASDVTVASISNAGNLSSSGFLTVTGPYATVAPTTGNASLSAVRTPATALSQITAFGPGLGEGVEIGNAGASFGARYGVSGAQNYIAFFGASLPARIASASNSGLTIGNTSGTDWASWSSSGNLTAVGSINAVNAIEVGWSTTSASITMRHDLNYLGLNADKRIVWSSSTGTGNFFSGATGLSLARVDATTAAFYTTPTGTTLANQTVANMTANNFFITSTTGAGNYFDQFGFVLGGTNSIVWRSGGNGTAGATQLGQNAAGVLQIGTTANNALGSLLLTNLTASGDINLTGRIVYTSSGVPFIRCAGSNVAAVFNNVLRHIQLRGGGEGGITWASGSDPSGVASSGITQIGAAHLAIGNGTANSTAGGLSLTNLTAEGTIGWSDVRMPRVVKTLRTECFESSLSAWQETSRQEASPTGPRWSVMGATPIVRQTHAAVATDLATAITRLNTLCTHLTNFGLFN